MRPSEFLSRLKRVRRTGRGSVACCPAHDDRRPSLSISEGDDGRILVKCFAGCTPEAIVAALGLRMSDLFPQSSLSQLPMQAPVRNRNKPLSVAELALAKGLPEAFLRDSCGLQDSADGVLIPYYDTDGAQARNRLRTGVAAREGSKWLPGNEPIVPYGVHRPSNGATSVVLVEGESDCWSLWQAGFYAIGIPGANMTHVLKLEYLKGIGRIWVSREPDKAGGQFVRNIAHHLDKIGWQGEIRELRMPDGVKDPHELYLRDRDRFRYSFMDLAERSPSITLEDLEDQATSFVSLADLLSEPDEETSWLVEGLLPSGGTSLFVAKPKVGKSITVQNLAWCVSRGEPFLGLPTVEGPVLYCALEEKKAEVRRHFAGMGATTRDGNLFFYIAHTPLDAMAWLIRAARRYKPVLIILDTLQKFVRLDDINDYAKVVNATTPLVTLARESGAHLAFTHHGNKKGGSDGDNVLGSTGLFGFVDTLILMRRVEPGRTISSIQRYGSPLEETVVMMDPHTFLISDAGSRADVDREHARRSILDHMRMLAEPATRPAILEAVPGRRESVNAAFTDLVKGGRFAQTGAGKKGDPFLYAMRPETDSSTVVPTICQIPERLESQSVAKRDETEVYSSSHKMAVPARSGTNILDHGNQNPQALFPDGFDVASPSFVEDVIAWRVSVAENA